MQILVKSTGSAAGSEMERCVFGLRLSTIFIALVASATPVLAADPAAEFLLRLFNNACLPNIAHTERVRAWAADHHLSEVQNPAALSIYVGAGDGGGLWAVPSSAGTFALSVRTETKACAVWAGAADPNEVSAGVKTMMDQLKRSGDSVSVIRDSTADMEFGRRHGLMYLVTAAGAPNSVALTMITNERPGGAYQATLQVGAVAASK